MPVWRVILSVDGRLQIETKREQAKDMPMI
jgi:hypothetical protein